MAKRKPEYIKKGDVCAVVLAQADCDTPLFIGKAEVDEDYLDRNEATFAGAFFMDDPGYWPVRKVSFDQFRLSYNFGQERSSDALFNRAERLGYVWVWTVVPSKTFRSSRKQ